MHYNQRINISQFSSIFSPELFGERAALRFHPKPPNLGIMMPKHKRPHSPSDFDLNPSCMLEKEVQGEIVKASVLVPIMRKKELTVLLTKRTDHLPTHAGQISFPGGKNDPTDRDPFATALREAREEIGLNKIHVEPLGFLDIYHTVTGYAITPIVAFLEAGCHLVSNPQEVSELFEVPLAFLMDPSNLKIHSKEFRGGTRNYYAFCYKDYYIWGATAGILKNMHEKLFSP